MKEYVWAYGVMTCESRLTTKLPVTLRSLTAAGFDKPRLFADGAREPFMEDYETTTRYPAVGVYGNWVLSMWELYLRDPHADMYAIFQDDMVCVSGLRAYLNAVPLPADGYLNLFTFHANESKIINQPFGWVESFEISTPAEKQALLGGRRQQAGKGAVALAFPRRAVITLLSALHMVEHALDKNTGRRGVDGSVVESMNKAGIREYIHNPSLVQHTGNESSIPGLNDKSLAVRRHWFARSFPGQDFDAMDLLLCPENAARHQANQRVRCRLVDSGTSLPPPSKPSELLRTV